MHVHFLRFPGQSGLPRRVLAPDGRGEAQIGSPEVSGGFVCARRVLGAPELLAELGELLAEDLLLGAPEALEGAFLLFSL